MPLLHLLRGFPRRISEVLRDCCSWLCLHRYIPHISRWFFPKGILSADCKYNRIFRPVCCHLQLRQDSFPVRQLYSRCFCPVLRQAFCSVFPQVFFRLCRSVCLRYCRLYSCSVLLRSRLFRPLQPAFCSFFSIFSRMFSFLRFLRCRFLSGSWSRQPARRLSWDTPRILSDIRRKSSRKSLRPNGSRYPCL